MYHRSRDPGDRMISASVAKVKQTYVFSLSVDIYDEDKDTTVDSTPVASAVATRATQMVELLSRDNVALREKLESMYHKMNNMQMVSTCVAILTLITEQTIQQG